MKAKVNQEACIGCGACVGTCNEVYDLYRNIEKYNSNYYKALFFLKTEEAISYKGFKQANK